VVTVHDLAFRHDPDHFTSRGVRFFERGLELTRAEAAAVIVPSEATREDCLTAGIEATRLHVIPHGVRASTTTPEQVTEFTRRFGLSRPYVLWAGTREPRKNLPRLVAAFDRLLDAGADCDLVLVGPDGWGPERARLNDVRGGHVRLLGRLPSSDLDAAYAGAQVFCYPSLREGFGMPVSEAMAHGTPVVTSRGTATEEAAGGAAVLVDPLDVDDIAAGLAAAMEPSARQTLRAASFRRAAELSWARAATQTVAVLRQVAAGVPPARPSARAATDAG
jgi:glycosyltransferase involved in cell wall biosynthesis